MTRPYFDVVGVSLLSLATLCLFTIVGAAFAGRFAPEADWLADLGMGVGWVAAVLVFLTLRKKHEARLKQFEEHRKSSEKAVVR